MRRGHPNSVGSSKKFACRHMLGPRARRMSPDSPRIKMEPNWRCRRKAVVVGVRREGACVRYCTTHRRGDRAAGGYGDGDVRGGFAWLVASPRHGKATTW